jgi:hypothetical protein
MIFINCGWREEGGGNRWAEIYSNTSLGGMHVCILHLYTGNLQVDILENLPSRRQQSSNGISESGIPSPWYSIYTKDTLDDPHDYLSIPL